MAKSEQDTVEWQHFLKGRLSKRWSSAQFQAYSERNDIGKRKYTNSRWRKMDTKDIPEGCIKFWKTWNTSVNGNTIPDTIQVRLHRLKIRATKVYTNDKTNINPIDNQHFSMPLQYILKHHTAQLQKWLDTVHAAKQTHTFILLTNKIKIAYNFGRSKLHHSYMTLFTISLRVQLHATFQEQTKWIKSYNDTMTASVMTLQHYFHPPIRPPSSPPNGDVIPWTAT